MRHSKLTVAVLLLSLFAFAKDKKQDVPSPADLAAITERGRLLLSYDDAAWHASDAVLDLKPKEGSVTRYIAKRTDSGWDVVFGRLNEARDKFLIVYEATRAAEMNTYEVKQHEPPLEDTGYYLAAFHAIETALKEFRGQNRPYNVAVLPAPIEGLYVYVMPAQTKRGIYPLGGDVRFLISSDGRSVLGQRRLHASILEIPVSAPGGTKVAGGHHTHVLSGVPEDTDVFHVLRRRPLVPEFVSGGDMTFRVEIDGTITIVK